MAFIRVVKGILPLGTIAFLAIAGCRNHMPHALTWPAGGDTQYTHAKPPEGGYYSNWDPYAVELEVTPPEDVNPVRTQHILIATVKDKEGKPLPNRRVEWIISEGSVGDIVEVDESGWRASRGYKVDNKYAVSHTNNFDHVLDRGNDDPSDDITLTEGQTWCVITSPIEGDTYITAYAPGIYDWNKHKVFAVKHWYDLYWEFPPAATNPTGTTHDFVTLVQKYSDRTPLAGYTVNYRIVDGPAAVFAETGSTTASVQTDSAGAAKVTIRQVQPAEGTNNVAIEIIRPGDVQCCKPGGKITEGMTSKTWIGPKIACNKSAPANVLAGQEFTYTIDVSNPSQVDATNVMVTDTLPDGITLVSSNPPSQGGGQTQTFSLGTVPAGQSHQVAMTVKATRTGTFENCAEVRADQNLSSRCCASTTATAPALAIEKTCTPDILICDTIEYVITVRNTGDGTATNVQLSDQLPDGITTTDGKNAVTASFGDLGPGQAKEVRFSAKASRTGSFTNSASVTADGGLSAQSSCTTTVRQPVLQVTKTGPGERYIGRNADFDITVTNTGDGPARDTVLTDTIPAGMQFVSASDGGAFGNNLVTWNLGTLEPGASRSVKVTLKATQRGSAQNTATARAYCAEASAQAALNMQGVPAILLEVIDVEDPIEVGANETYIITVTNQGSAEDTNIVVTAVVPAEMEYVSGDGPTRANVEGKTITFSPLATLAPGEKATYRVVTKGTAVNDVRFKVSITSDQTTSPVEETESTHVY